MWIKIGCVLGVLFHVLITSNFLVFYDRELVLNVAATDVGVLHFCQDGPCTEITDSKETYDRNQNKKIGALNDIVSHIVFIQLFIFPLYVCWLWWLGKLHVSVHQLALMAFHFYCFAFCVGVVESDKSTGDFV